MNKEHAENLVNHGCICCELMGTPQKTHTEIHHIREGQGKSQRAGDFLTIPLCVDCHRGTHGVHGDKKYLKILKMTELDLLNLTLLKVFRGK